MAAVARSSMILHMPAMKSSGLISGLCVATLFVASSLRGAEAGPMAGSAPSGSPEAMRLDRMEELLRRFDRNGDGKLDDDERAEAREAMLREQIERRNAAAAVAPGGAEQARTRMLEMFDQNHDGRLDE